MELAAWRDHGVIAGITTRDGAFNLGLSTAEPVERVIARWRSLLTAFQPRFHTFHLGLQVHGSTVLRHDAGPPGWTIHDGSDGHVTGARCVLLLVTVADCVPVFLLHPPSRTVGLLHAGWRGIAAGVLERGLEAVAVGAGCQVADVVMHCGVSICGPCYEVGPEVMKALGEDAAPGRSHVDLRARLAARADAAGVRQVSVSGWCTAHHAEHFYSHRRSGGADGRMVAYVGVPGA